MPRPVVRGHGKVRRIWPFTAHVLNVKFRLRKSHRIMSVDTCFHLLSIGEREDLRPSIRIDERPSIVGREAVWHDMNGGFFGRGASPIDASVCGPIVRAWVQLVDGAQDETSGSPVSDLVID